MFKSRRLGRRTADLLGQRSATSRASHSPPISRRMEPCYLKDSDEQSKGTRPYGDLLFSIRKHRRLCLEPVNRSTTTPSISPRGALAGAECERRYRLFGSIYRERYLPIRSRILSYWGRRSCRERCPRHHQGQSPWSRINDYHNLHATVTRVMPMNGEASRCGCR